MFPKPVSPKMLAGIIVLFGAVAWHYAFDPLSVFSASDRKGSLVATIVSDDREVMSLRYVKMEKLRVSLPDGNIVTAIGISKILRKCSKGDKIAVRLNKTVKGQPKSYRVISTSCAPAFW